MSGPKLRKIEKPDKELYNLAKGFLDTYFPKEDEPHKNTKRLKKLQKQANYRPYNANKGR